MELTYMRIQDVAERLAAVHGEIFAALDRDRREWWEAVAVSAIKLIDEEIDATLGDYGIERAAAA